jgi:hypothetical protein
MATDKIERKPGDVFLKKKSLQQPSVVYNASASGTKDPGSNPDRV